MNPADANDSRDNESQEALAGGEGGGRHAAGDIGMPETGASESLGGDAESGALSDDVESGGP